MITCLPESALGNKPTYSVTTGAVHMPGYWFVESKWDSGFSASGLYHYTKDSAELELEIINCDDQDKAVELQAQLIGMMA